MSDKVRSLQELNSLALKTRRILGEDSYSPIDVFALVNGWKNKKITVVLYPFSERISGMCTCVEKDIMICINSGSSYGRQRFTLAHELYHLLYRKNVNRVICGMSIDGNKPDPEKEADRFASYLLMPYDSLLQYSDGLKEWTLGKIIEAEQFFQISHMAMLTRLQTDGFLSEAEAKKYQGIPVLKIASALGFGKELYLPLPEERQYFTTGEYIRKVEMLFDKDIISSGKKEELLLDAFRADIVYNLDEEEAHLND